MAESKSFHADAEVLGNVVLGFIDAFPSEARDVALKLLAWNGIQEVRAERYYRLESFLDAMEDMSETFGSSVLFLIGEQFAMKAILPTEVTSLEACLASMDEAYRSTHKGSDIGSYEYARLHMDGHLKKVRIVCSTPYPCAFDRGMIEGFVQRLRPANCEGIFWMDDDSEGCRKRGDDHCTYLISWLLRLESDLEFLLTAEQTD